MIEIETFIAVDKEGNEYSVFVNQHSSKTLSGIRTSKVFSLESNGEIIKPDNEEKIFFVPSSNLFIGDPRKKA